ncbi:MAG: hypothetical protein AAGF15_05125 [Pseudomonadota bacterium]
MPQFDPSLASSQIFWLILTFGALYFVMARFALPSVREVISHRDQKIDANVEKARELNEEATRIEQINEERLSHDRAEAQKLLAVTKKQVQDELDAETKALDERLQSQIESVDAEIREATVAAMKDVNEIAKSTCVEILNQLNVGSVKKTAINAAVKKELSERATQGDAA